MAVQRAPAGTSLIDVLDRILDKGIVVDGGVRNSPIGIDLTTVETRVVIESIETYVTYGEDAGITSTAARPALGPGEGGTGGGSGSSTPASSIGYAERVNVRAF